MATLHSSHLLCASSHLATSSQTALRNPRFLRSFQLGFPQRVNEFDCKFGDLKPYGMPRSPSRNLFSALHVAAGQSGDPRRAKLDQVIDFARTTWDSLPEVVRNFPWSHALDSYIQLTIDLVLEVAKYVCVPLFVVTSLSEMSYCAHQRKLRLIVVPLLIGFAVAGVMKQTALDVAPRLKNAEIPWHLICMAIFFALLKLPGPYYPYWGRILIPHTANGALLGTLWCFFMWHRQQNRDQDNTKTESQNAPEVVDLVALSD